MHGLLLIVPGLVLAGPNEGGTLILHANPGLVFTSDIQNYCGMAALDSCSAAITSVPWEPGTRIVFHALAAFPSGSRPRLKSVSFGIQYDPERFVMSARGTCADFELPDGAWPATGTGTAQSWTTGAQSGVLTETYWFAGYAYSEQEGEDSTSVSLIPHPLQHGVFVDDSFPAEVDTIAGYGTLGFGMAGALPCPTSGGDVVWVPGDELDGGTSEPGSSGDEPEDPGEENPPVDTEGCAPNVVLIRFSPNQVSFPQENPALHERFVLPLSAATFSRSGLQDFLANLGVQTLETVAPHWRHMTEEDQRDIHGRHVDLVDFTDVYRVRLDGRESVENVITDLQGRPGVEHAECDQIMTGLTEGEFDSLWTEQWYFENTGQDGCTPGLDVNLISAWLQQDRAGTKIGISDLGGIDTSLAGIRGYVDITLSRSFIDREWWTYHWHTTPVASIAGTGSLDAFPLASIPNLPASHGDSLLVCLTVGGLDSLTEVAGPAALSYVASDTVGGRIRVVNHSWGQYRSTCRLSRNYSTALRDAFRNAFLCDLNLVCSAGNSINFPCPGDTALKFPAAFSDYALAVASVNCTGNPNPINHTGSYIDLAAPGWNIWVLDWDGPRVASGWGGTSYSAPLVSGAIALLLGADPLLTNEDCYNLLKLTATPLRWNSTQVGSGMLNVYGAIGCVTGPRYVVHDSIPDFEVSLDDTSLSVVLRQVPPYTDSTDVERDSVFLVDRYRLAWSANIELSSPSWVEYVWPRGKSCAGWRRIDDSIDWYYDGLFYANHADVDWTGGNSPTFYSYVYKIRSAQNGDSLGWAPFDPYDPPDGAQVTYSYVVNQVEAAAVQMPAQRDPPFRVQGRGGRWLFELPPDRAAPLSIEIFNVAGRQVQVLRAETDEERVRGMWWNERDSRGRRVAAGLYLAFLRSSGEQARSPAVRLLIVR